MDLSRRQLMAASGASAIPTIAGCASLNNETSENGGETDPTENEDDNQGESRGGIAIGAKFTQEQEQELNQIQKDMIEEQQNLEESVEEGEIDQEEYQEQVQEIQQEAQQELEEKQSDYITDSINTITDHIKTVDGIEIDEYEEEMGIALLEEENDPAEVLELLSLPEVAGLFPGEEYTQAQSQDIVEP